MRIIDDLDALEPFIRLEPEEASAPFVVGSPHSGACYPRSFLAASRLDEDLIRRSEDAHVDRLVDECVKIGLPLVAATFPRAWCDVNREPYELDPRLFRDKLPAYANIASLRVAGGLGTIARVVADRQEIYRAPIPVSEALMRIERFYKPYHAALRRQIALTHIAFGAAALIDCHSMPSRPRPAEGRIRADFVIGDRFGTSAARILTETIVETLDAMGYNVVRNKPYAGGFITEHYGRPARGIHAIQIEINRALYMDEATLVPHAGFLELRKAMTALFSALCAIPAELLAARDNVTAREDMAAE